MPNKEYFVVYAAIFFTIGLIGFIFAHIFDLTFSKYVSAFMSIVTPIGIYFDYQRIKRKYKIKQNT